MEIAIPTASGRLCMHFGHSEQFAVVEVDADRQAIVGTTYLTPPAHEPGVLPRWLHEKGADAIMAAGMGQRAPSLFAQTGVKVVVGAPAARPEDVVAAYLAGTLEVGQRRRHYVFAPPIAGRSGSRSRSFGRHGVGAAATRSAMPRLSETPAPPRISAIQIEMRRV